MWNHAECIMKKVKQIKSHDDIEGLDSLRWEDQQNIRKYVDGSISSDATTTVSVSECGVEVSKTSRATCRQCNEKIMKGEVRISTKPDGQGARSLAWHHTKCFMESSPSTEVEKLVGWDNLSVSDQEAFHSTSRKASIDGKQENEEKSSKAGTKRKRTAKGNQKSEVSIVEGNLSANKVSAENEPNESENQNQSASDLKAKLEAQTKELWAIKDELKKDVTTAELREMLEANSQDSSGSELDLRDRCADGMLFGALDNCPVCSGPLHYSGGAYRCHGYLSEWSKCSYNTNEPKRLKGKWKIPEETSNEYLSKWFKLQKAKKPVRILLPPSSNALGSPHGTSQSSQSKRLEDLKVAIAGVLKKSLVQSLCYNRVRNLIDRGNMQVECKNEIEEAGGIIHAKIKKDTKCLVVSAELDDQNPEIKKARRMKIPVVREDYLVDCAKRKKMLPFNQYQVESSGELSRSMVTVKVKGRSAVHESSGLQDSGHILEDGKSIYNTTLNMSDLSTGINSYYILQIIQEDKGSDCHVFRKWGRVGNDKIGGNKLEEMTKSDAIQEFKRLFLEKTGNPWEAWEQKKNFQKQPGRFFPLNIDYGVSKQVSKKRHPNSAKSLLAPPLAELMKMLFNVETYRAAMMEFEINLTEMPLGKLSKHNIQNGFEALTEIQNLLNSNSDASIKESLLISASNRFFTVIPSIHPHVIRDEEDFKLKVKMLEALQDIEIASRLVGFDADNDDTLDEKYEKLRCSIGPIPHDSDDYRLVEKYLLTTHAPTHTGWTLELEDVFTLEREGESDKFAPYREKLQNKMLLWHDMVSKSAQYCFTDKNNPVGLMLLSEVALGEVYELKKSAYIEKLPEGKHSTKGLGKMIPQPSEYMKWTEEVVVPCGKPVPSKIKASELMYNEYIVYDTSQVKMQFLLKVRFNHKR
ncbi:hypothetical protein GIB67_039583 [Kingdonia uniflora]|uniref:Poly [ADP-ribose] polymerase n=1 Tax=Kingdonia uniflora TaxID=39325 RepID=A0A7J7P6G2_9MAGN|nr:hypothetical protein GIB67_039583 [Kingdonia uniflora]